MLLHRRLVPALAFLPVARLIIFLYIVIMDMGLFLFRNRLFLTITAYPAVAVLCSFFAFRGFPVRYPVSEAVLLHRRLVPALTFLPVACSIVFLLCIIMGLINRNGYRSAIACPVHSLYGLDAFCADYLIFIPC